MEFEARAARLCLPGLEQLAREHPLWMAHYDDVDPDTADVDVLFGLLESAPNDFARGIIFGKLTLRSQVAAVSGRPF